MGTVESRESASQDGVARRPSFLRWRSRPSLATASTSYATFFGVGCLSVAVSLIEGSVISVLLSADGAIRPKPDMLTIHSIAPETFSGASPAHSKHKPNPVPKTNRLNNAPAANLGAIATSASAESTPVKPLDAAIALREQTKETAGLSIKPNNLTTQTGNTNTLQAPTRPKLRAAGSETGRDQDRKSQSRCVYPKSTCRLHNQQR